MKGTEERFPLMDGMDTMFCENLPTYSMYYIFYGTQKLCVHNSSNESD